MKILVIREHDEVVVSIMKHKEENTYSFVNLTKGHICPCKFNSEFEAVKDLNRYVKEGKIKHWRTMSNWGE